MTGLASASPRDVVPGDPAAAEELAAALRTYAGGAAENAAQLRGAGDGHWVGEAADGFRARLGELPDKLERGVDAFVSASQSLAVYADALRDGQATAARAIDLAGQAEREHAAWQRQVDAYNRVVEAGGVPDHRPPETSPGAATMAESEALVAKARGPVEDAAAKAAAVLNDGAAQAPDTSSFVGDAIRGYWHHTKQFWIGAGEATYGLGEFVFTHSNVYALINPEGYAENMTSLAQGLVWGAQHPVEFGKAIIDWETWKTNPSRAMGHLLPDALLTAATAGAGGAGVAASRGASAASRLSRATDDVADIAEDMEDAGDAARASDRLADTTDEAPPPAVLEHVTDGGQHVPLGPRELPTDGPVADLVQDYKRYGDLTEEEFIKKHWDADADDGNGWWRYPENDGFSGASQRYVPQVGDRLDRFGGPGGKYLSPEGTPYQERAIPPSNLNPNWPDYNHHIYEVIRPWDSEGGRVDVGEVAPAFEQPGGGIQLKTERSIRWLEEHGYIREVQE